MPGRKTSFYPDLNLYDAILGDLRLSDIRFIRLIMVQLI